MFDRASMLMMTAASGPTPRDDENEQRPDYPQR